jgi:hypothetical protein
MYDRALCTYINIGLCTYIHPQWKPLYPLCSWPGYGPAEQWHRPRCSLTEYSDKDTLSAIEQWHRPRCSLTEYSDKYTLSAIEQWQTRSFEGAHQILPLFHLKTKQSKSSKHRVIKTQTDGQSTNIMLLYFQIIGLNAEYLCRLLLQNLVTATETRLW